MLVAGLAVGLASPAAAAAVQPYVGGLVIAVLSLSFLRVRVSGHWTTWSAVIGSVATNLLFQLVVPLTIVLLSLGLGVGLGTYALGLVLILSAAPIMGAAPIAAMAGADPAPALRQTLLGTMLLPLTVLPVFALVPAFGAGDALLRAVFGLFAMIGLAGGLALLLRRSGIVRETPATNRILDAMTAALLAVVVVGLMVGPSEALRFAPARVGAVLVAVCAVSFGLLAAVAYAWPRKSMAVPVAVVAANRNVALFFGVIPADVLDELMLIIGCYQIPMYLTPIVLPRLVKLIRR